LLIKGKIQNVLIQLFAAILADQFAEGNVAAADVGAAAADASAAEEDDAIPGCISRRCSGFR